MVGAAKQLTPWRTEQRNCFWRRSGLVSYEELGTRNVYRLDPAGLNELRAWLDSFWETALDSYAQRARADSAGDGTEPRHN